jgi:tripartite-type tricarboxylate transporter receptor subunit TctC
LQASGRGDAASVVRHFRNVSFRESAAGVNLQNVPFAGNGPALTALLG